MTLPTRLRDAVFEPPGPGQDRLILAAGTLAAQGVFGLVWMDDDLRVVARFGRMVEHIEIGAHLTSVVDPLFGQDEQIKALKRAPDRRFELPNVAIVDDDGLAPRYNYSLAWLGSSTGFVMLVSSVLSQCDLETELTQHVRRRMLAEERMVSQSIAIQQMNAELSASNQELAEFAHVISHDLKAPMRALRFSADDLERALANPDTGGDPQIHIERLRAQTRRMSAMLSGLLTFAALGRRDEALEAIDTRELILEIIMSLPRGPGMEASVTGTWPVVTTMVAPLDIVLRNLIENAIRHHDRTSGHIEVHCSPKPDALEISVRDDGCGIPLEWQKAVFRPFATVTPPADEAREAVASRGLPAGGMGLAIVQRAVEVAGGRLTLKSNPAVARGSTFEVHWPCRTPRPNSNEGVCP